MTTRLFVYGTLRKGSRNSMHHMLAPGATLVGRGRMRGRLFDLGEYPGFVPSDEGAWVHGEVYTLRTGSDTLARLDDYEGCGSKDLPPREFERVRREAVMTGGARLQVWVYVYKGPVTGIREIASGDYCSPREG